MPNKYEEQILSHKGYTTKVFDEEDDLETKMKKAKAFVADVLALIKALKHNKEFAKKFMQSHKTPLRKKVVGRKKIESVRPIRYDKKAQKELKEKLVKQIK